MCPIITIHRHVTQKLSSFYPTYVPHVEILCSSPGPTTKLLVPMKKPYLETTLPYLLRLEELMCSNRVPLLGSNYPCFQHSLGRKIKWKVIWKYTNMPMRYSKKNMHIIHILIMNTILKKHSWWLLLIHWHINFSLIKECRQTIEILEELSRIPRVNCNGCIRSNEPWDLGGCGFHLWLVKVMWVF